MTWLAPEIARDRAMQRLSSPDPDKRCGECGAQVTGQRTTYCCRGCYETARVRVNRLRMRERRADK